MANEETEEPNKQGIEALDLLYGANAIAAFVFGDQSKARRVYHLSEKSKTKFPTFKLGGVLCSRKSVLRKYFDEAL
jgi:hypothetical protein